jgi:hypothetical protein
MSLSRLSREVLRQNARFRAWRALGVPVEGRWEEGALTVILRLRCLSCSFGIEKMFTRAIGVARQVAAYRPLVCCDHLEPLRGEAPPALAAIEELELLSGG